MALVSPGVEVQIIDESAYSSAAVGTVPLIIFATQQDKTAPSGAGLAAGTTKANANKLAIISSQRELASLYGVPFFEQSTTGTPVHGGERNEYGLMAAYSLLGITNRVMTLRADVDLAALKGTAVRPRGNPADGIYWLDTADTQWGIFQWNAGTQTFSAAKTLAITGTSNLTSGVPIASYGSPGDYAVVTANTNNPVYYKTSANVWVEVGSSTWQQAIPSIVGTAAPSSLTATHDFLLNSVNIAVLASPDNNLTGVAGAINTARTTGKLPGVYADVVNGFLQIYVTDTASSTSTTTSGTTTVGAADGKLIIAAGTIGTPLPTMGLTAGTYGCITTAFSTNVSIPQWRAIPGVVPRPTGSVWIKTNSANLGASITLSRYNLSQDTFTSIAAPLYPDDQSAIADLDTTGGKLLPVNSVYAQYNVNKTGTVSYKLFRRTANWPTKVTGTWSGAVTGPTFTSADAFTIQVSVAGSATLTTARTVTLTGTTTAAFVTQVNGLGIANLTAQQEATGAISFIHALGGVIVLKNTTNTPLTTAGFTSLTTGVRAGTASDMILSNWAALTYVADSIEPSTQPDENKLWYYSTIDQVDVMIHDGTKWRGYQNVTSDARGYSLNTTDPTGVIVSASKPTTQTDSTDLVLGDLWLDTSDLENYPKLYRWQLVAGVYRWVAINNSDQNSESGIVFADARWDATGLTDPITANLTTTMSLLSSDYLDLDAPLAAAYPRGTLLFNTRRSGFNVKKYVSNYFNPDDFDVPNWSSTATYVSGDKVVYTNGKIYKANTSVAAGVLPTTASWNVLENSAWVSVAGNREDGSPYMGRHAVRNTVIEAMKSAVDSNQEIREEQREFTLIACPGYSEMIPNLVALNNDRHNTAFIVGDTPLRLEPTGVSIQAWSSGASGGVLTDGALTIADPYLAVYYPSALGNDLNGNTIAVPASHMALRTMIRSDNASYPWFAPAGSIRGLVDNATSLGYVNATSGEFVQFGLPVGLRDTLYEAKINPITYLPGAGLTIYGQKTRNSITSALDRINVARLVCYLRDRLNKLARPFLFEPNDKITRDQIKQITEQMLNDLVAKRALYDYLVVCDTTNNTPVRIDRNELWLDVAIEPVKAVEFIYIPLRIKNTGAIAGTV
jgi:hypothetical protein